MVVVVAWFLLQAGFAEICESVYERLPVAGMISFPGIEEDPIAVAIQVVQGIISAG